MKLKCKLWKREVQLRCVKMLTTLISKIDHTPYIWSHFLSHKIILQQNNTWTIYTWWWKWLFQNIKKLVQKMFPPPTPQNLFQKKFISKFDNISWKKGICDKMLLLIKFFSHLCEILHTKYMDGCHWLVVLKTPTFHLPY